ncbi:hypothetical protein U1Q18_048105 [Sarracenia purpurea var. burkii]
MLNFRRETFKCPAYPHLRFAIHSWVDKFRMCLPIEIKSSALCGAHSYLLQVINDEGLSHPSYAGVPCLNNNKFKQKPAVWCSRGWDIGGFSPATWSSRCDDERSLSVGSRWSAAPSRIQGRPFRSALIVGPLVGLALGLPGSVDSVVGTLVGQIVAPDSVVRSEFVELVFLCYIRGISASMVPMEGRV